jgi:hypothetical protein
MPGDLPCSHCWCDQGKLNITFTIDDWQGPTDALVRCTLCGTTAFLNVIDWAGKNLSSRVFSLSLLPNSAVQVFMRNMRSDYCDLERHRAEVEALITTRRAAESIVLTRDLQVVSIQPVTSRKPKLAAWRDDLPAGQSWFDCFTPSPEV